MPPFNHQYIFLTGWGFQAKIFSIFPTPENCFVQYPEYVEHPENILSGDYLCLFDWIAQTMNTQFSGENFTLIGWSLGGLFAIYLAYLFPEKYKKIILISSLPQFVGATSISNKFSTGITQAQAEKFTTFAELDMAGLMRYFVQLVQYPNASLKIRQYLYQYQDSAQAYLRLKLYLTLLLNINLTWIYRQLTIPVICLFGEQDAVISVYNVEDKQPKSAIVHRIPNAGHALFLTHPDSLRQLMR